MRDGLTASDVALLSGRNTNGSDRIMRCAWKIE